MRSGIMAVEYLKRARGPAGRDIADMREQARRMLERIAQEGEAAVRDYAERLDGWSGAVRITPEEIARAREQTDAQAKADIRFAHDNVRRFAEAQLASIGEFEIEMAPGFLAGQRLIPVSAVGCYVPGGRYAHVASAIMTITTARVAGVSHVSAVSPPRASGGIAPALLYAMDLCGADAVLALGGVQAIAAMTNGLFGLPAVDMVVGPGNQYVAEAKRILFGQVGIDVLAGPTDSMVLADGGADARTVAWDLVGQAEHGVDSPVQLVANERGFLLEAQARILECIDQLPDANGANARAAWRDHGELILCGSLEEMAQVADRYAPEHLHVHMPADSLDWWLGRLRSYGSLFLGAETTVPFGDKCAGPNHVLPTRAAARYSGGLSVHKFLKVVTWQRAARSAVRPFAEATARISRLEGMEGHARCADLRLEP